MPSLRQLALVASLLAVCVAAAGFAQYAEQNVNMVAGTQWPGGDPFLRQQNEPSVAVSTRNPLHVFAGANDYRSVDIPFNAAPRPDDEDTGDAWLSYFVSTDGGNRWMSTLLDGYPQQSNVSSPLNGFQAAADPVVRAANNGLFYYAGIVMNRGTNPLSGVFVARFIDRNNTERGNPIAFLGTKLLDQGTSGQFIDKPWVAVAPMTNGGQCTVDGQTFAAQNVYLAYTTLVGNDNNIRTKIMFTRSTDCGTTWAAPIKLSETYSVNQAVNIAVDPANGNNIYVAWRRFADVNDLNSIIVAKSTNAGGSFGKGVDVADITPFDQKTTGAAIRTNAYPTMAVDGSGRVYIAWSQRDAVTQDGRIVIMNSADGQTAWSTPQPVAPISGGLSLSRGNQFMPSMTFIAGKLTLVWYDLRDDSTMATYKFNKTTHGYDPTRVPLGNLFLGQPQIVFWNSVSDTSPDPQIKLVRRHTLDVYSAESTALGPSATFAPALRVTRYKFGSVRPDVTIRDLQFDAPNLPMFRQGTVPFFGDYIDVAAYTLGGTARVRHAVWTDNRDVRAPSGTPPDWTKYTPVRSPSLFSTSTFDPTQAPPPCTVDPSGVSTAGSRNQNIYTARVTDGLFAGSPGNAKPLSGTLQHAFTIFVENSLASPTLYHLSFAQLPTNTSASFEQFAGNPAIDVNVPAHSTSTRTVFVTGPPHSTVNVLVVQDGGGLTATISLNPDKTNPDDLDVATNEVFDPTLGDAAVSIASVSNPDVPNPDVPNPDVPNPDVPNPDVPNQDVMNPDVPNPDVPNPDVPNPDVPNPDVPNPDVPNPDVPNGSLTDTTWNATNQGNTTGGYTVKLFKLQDLPPGVYSQLVLNKIYDTPVAHGCDLAVQHNRQVIATLNSPVPTSNVNDLSNPSLTDQNAAGLWLAPGESGRITVRLGSATPGLILDASQYFVPVVIAHAVDTADVATGIRTPPVSLTITTTSLPDAFAGQPYSATLQAIGGRGPYTWTASGLPQGLSVSPIENAWAITGTPAQSGAFTVTITVTDSSTPPRSKSATLSLNVISLTITTTALPNGNVGSPYSLTMQSTGGTGTTRTWTVLKGLPTGLTLNPSTGVLAGTPLVPIDSSVTLQVADSAVPPHIASTSLPLHIAGTQQPIGAITPSTAAAGFGQLVFIDIANYALPNLSGAQVWFTDGQVTEPGFLFLSPSTPARIYARLPFANDGQGSTNLTPGPVTVYVTQPGIVRGPATITLSSTPGAPTMQTVYGLDSPPSPNRPCGGAIVTSVSSISAGQGLAVSGYGIDTVGVTLRFQQGNSTIDVQSGCGEDSASLGEAGTFVVPGLSRGSVSVSMGVTVNGVQSAFSAPVTLNVIAPTYACVGNQMTVLDTWTGGATGDGGTAPSFTTPGAVCLDSIADYHWNGGVAIAGTSIGLTEVCNASCTSLGPWTAAGTAGTNSIIVNWTATPPAPVVINGTYTVVDTDTGTWSYDLKDSKKTAFSRVLVHSAVVTTLPPIQ